MKTSQAILAVFLAGVLAGASAEPNPRFPVSASQMKALGITVQPLQAGAGQVRVPLPGRVVLPANAERVVSAPLPGLAVQVLVRPDQQVARGTALVRIASPELGALQLQLMQAASRSRLARRAEQRERALFAEGIVAERRLLEAQATLAEADAALAQARAALRLAGMGSAAIERVAAGGKPEDAVVLTAPVSGVVTALDVKPGQRVEPASALLAVAPLDRLALELDVAAADAARWRPGTRLALQGHDAQAVVRSAGAVAAGGSQTIRLLADIEGASPALRPGVLVTALAPASTQAPGWDVPLGALAHLGKQAYVFVRTRDGFEARRVQELSSAGQRVRVAGPLAAGDAVAVTGVVALKGSWLGEKGGE